ncbi:MULTISPECIES: Sec-independent protein translocase protein TatB [Rhizobium/Agrobacterium group]|uniref:Sec-independent protein translocase protein TatB n=2 Tax=Rhizobium/Agrobacterium group TaxID=227290 RepID=B9JXE0_ALLAM|nr:SEC-independent protein translocase protein [Allorhizobium ampelinum S4]MCF1446405.1 twin-arginine translocase subunit TatB [Allorhizobium ampelinum]MUO31184.1 twin-arginine translocase subunit TatB [Agrobacterium vitis]MCF1492713.1 twin-arginine translocase subunit TatB [Allorhizobium ampelinum]MUO44793.1 twin-arginine translocase subunit TatB [Agrobacterium vitis]
MLDIGWSELLVIAVVLIVVVGPKDLPPMLRAFGKMTTRLRKTAGEFRAQFDEALREADMDDVRRTIDDAQRLNPANALREAINPLRQMGADIRSDLQRSTQVDHFPEDDSSRLPLADEPARPMTAEDLPPLAPLGDTLAKPQLPGSAAAAPVTAPVVKAAEAVTPVEKAPVKRVRKPKSDATATEVLTSEVSAPKVAKTAKATKAKAVSKPVKNLKPAAVTAPITQASVDADIAVSDSSPKTTTRTKRPAPTKGLPETVAVPALKKKTVSRKKTVAGEATASQPESRAPDTEKQDTSKQDTGNQDTGKQDTSKGEA